VGCHTVVENSRVQLVNSGSLIPYVDKRVYVWAAGKTDPVYMCDTEPL